MYAGRYQLSRSRAREARNQAILKKPIAHRMLFTYRDCVNYANTHKLKTSEIWDHVYCLYDQVINLGKGKKWHLLGLVIVSSQWELGAGSFSLLVGNESESTEIVTWENGEADKSVSIIGGQLDDNVSTFEVYTLDGDTVRMMNVEGTSSGSFAIWVKKGTEKWKPAEIHVDCRLMLFVE